MVYYTKFSRPHDFGAFQPEFDAMIKRLERIAFTIQEMDTDEDHKYNKDRLTGGVYNAISALEDASFHSYYIGEDMEEPDSDNCLETPDYFDC